MGPVRARFFGHSDNRTVAVARWMIDDTRDDDGDVNLAAALMLAQLTWWLAPDGRSGRIRAEHEHDGMVWLVRSDDGWQEEIGLSDRAARRARTRLAKLGFIECRQMVDGGVKCTHIRRLPLPAETTDGTGEDELTIRPETANQVRPETADAKPFLAESRVRASCSSKDLEVVEKSSVGTKDATRLCVLLADLIERNGSKRPTVTTKWVTEADRMLRLDGRDPVKAARLICWCQDDPFWRSNVLSMATFRAKYDQLRLRANEARQGRKPEWQGPAGKVNHLSEGLPTGRLDVSGMGRR